MEGNKKILEDLRSSISNVDKDIVSLLRRRFLLSKKIAEFKKENGLEILDKRQENEVILRYKKETKDLGISEDFIVKTVDLILQESRRIQTQSITNQNKKSN